MDFDWLWKSYLLQKSMSFPILCLFFTKYSQNSQYILGLDYFSGKRSSYKRLTTTANYNFLTFHFNEEWMMNIQPIRLRLCKTTLTRKCLECLESGVSLIRIFNHHPFMISIFLLICVQYQVRAGKTRLL